MPIKADARPTKSFFINNLTRDLALEDAILDLVDNSIDAYITTRNVDVSANLLRRQTRALGSPSPTDLPLISISISEDEFQIADKCGGIDLELAKTTVFRLGKPESAPSSFLGVYGIGLKRAIFKLGGTITIESHTANNGFRMALNVANWSTDDDDWELPLTPLSAARSLEESGTVIRVTDLSPDVKFRLEDKTLLPRLTAAIASTYPLFLASMVTVSINGQIVKPTHPPIGSSEEISPAFRQFELDGVSVEILAGLAARKRGEWNAERAGWYVLCNGRVVVSADRTSLTGWGVYGPTFVSKFRGFIGVAFFFCPDPSLLPWTTTKRGLNLESRVFQSARKEMNLAGKPVLTFLNNMYPTEPAEEIPERNMADLLVPADIATLTSRAEAPFTTRHKGTARKKSTVSVQYKAEKVDVERIRKRLDDPDLSVSKIGFHTFLYFLEQECSQ
jgi:hypothetical protein